MSASQFPFTPVRTLFHLLSASCLLVIRPDFSLVFMFVTPNYKSSLIIPIINAIGHKWATKHTHWTHVWLNQKVLFQVVHLDLT